MLAACGPKAEDEDTRDSEAGGGQGGETSTANHTCPESNESIDPTAALDDFEDQDGLLLPIGDRNGGWWTAGDDTLGGTITPPRSDDTGELASPVAIPGGRCGSDFAMRVSGQGYTDWGSLLGTDLKWGPREGKEEGTIGYDATGRTGIEFWARVGDTSTNQVRFAISDVNNEPAGGRCVEDGDVGEECYDTFGVYLTGLDTVWHHYRIPFAGLGQRDFGPQVDGVALDQIYTVQFNFDPGAIFDFWVDDIGFY